MNIIIKYAVMHVIINIQVTLLLIRSIYILIKLPIIHLISFVQFILV